MARAPLSSKQRILGASTAVTDVASAHELGLGRRSLLGATAASIAVVAWTPLAWGQTPTKTLALEALQPQLRQAVGVFTAGAPVVAGNIRFDIDALVENGNTVPVEVEVASPMTALDHVKRIGIFNERNPVADMIVVRLSPASGRARVAARLRLSTTQTVMAVAELGNGSFVGAAAEVIVTLAACVEDAPLR